MTVKDAADKRDVGQQIMSRVEKQRNRPKILKRQHKQMGIAGLGKVEELPSIVLGENC